MSITEETQQEQFVRSATDAAAAGPEHVEVATAYDAILLASFGGVTVYRGGDVTATLDMAVAVRADISAGATVTSATLRIDRPGRDTVVMPVGGLIGCV